MSRAQKGFSNILLLIVVLAIAGIGVYIYMMKTGTDMAMIKDKFVVKEVMESDFEKLDEPEGTPDEIDNEALDELDAMMNEIDAMDEGEDLSDLEL